MTDGPDHQVRISITMHWFLLSFDLGSVSGATGSFQTTAATEAAKLGPHSAYWAGGGVGPSGPQPDPVRVPLWLAVAPDRECAREPLRHPRVAKESVIGPDAKVLLDFNRAGRAARTFAIPFETHKWVDLRCLSRGDRVPIECRYA